MISFAYVFFLVRTDTAYQGELSLLSDLLSFSSADPGDKGTGPIPILMVGLDFALALFVDLAFATLGVPCLWLLYTGNSSSLQWSS